MYAPSFWSKPAGALAPLLSLAGLPYHLATRLRFAIARPIDAGIPVICVGNFTAGGTGKTPAAIAIADLLKSEGFNPVFISKGYGGGATGPLLLDADRYGAETVGDEPLLLCRTAPVIVARDRRAGARSAIAAGADIIIMDDGLQDPSLKKTIAIALVDGQTGLGNGLVIPAGPLRARLGFQLSLADAVLVVGDGLAGDRVAAMAEAVRISQFRGQIKPAPGAPRLSGQKVLAFAGIGRPEKFFQTLRTAGADIAEMKPFPDHHVVRDGEARHLMERALALDAMLVTTEKDMARLGDTGEVAKLKIMARTFPVRMVFEKTNGLAAYIKTKLTG